MCRLGHSVISTPEVVFRTALQQDVGPWDPALPHTADLEMWLRFAANADVAYVNADQAFYLRHSNNMTLRRTPLIDLEQRRAAFDTLFAGYGDRIPEAALLHRSVRRHLAREALWKACRAYDRRRLTETPVVELIAFANDASPDAARSALGFGLKWRRALGPRVVPYLQPLVLSAVARRIGDRLWWRRWATKGI